jgi:5'-3' exonuclease
MGIRGLSGWIGWACPEGKEIPDWSNFKDTTIGIDVLGFLYKAKLQKISPITYLARLIIACRKHSITPVPIFDGKPPEEKRKMLEQRFERRTAAQLKHQALKTDTEKTTMSLAQREVVEQELQKLEHTANYLTSDERDVAKQLFYACGIMSYNATGEADTVLAYFARRGTFAAVISNDFDMLARGVPILLVPETYALPGDKSGWQLFRLDTITKAVQFTYEQFLEMCVLMGCDYTTGVKTLQYKSAYWAIKYRGQIEKTIKQYSEQDQQVYLKAKEMLSGVSETQESLMGAKQWDKWATGKPNVEPETIEVFRRHYLKEVPEEDLRLLLQLTPLHPQETVQLSS